jgi:purine-binding chemotaxis protein CheW
MTNQSFLTFTLHGLLLAIDTKVVRKIIWLPELTLIEECPSYIAGVINLRGKIVPVMDLNVRFGHAAPGYNCSDSVIILGVSEFIAGIPNPQALFPILNSEIDLMGIIVNEVLDVIDISKENIEPPPFEQRELTPHSHFVSGEAKTGEDIIMIIDPRTLFDSEFVTCESEIEQPEIISESAISYFSPEANRQERVIFHNRAINLQQVSDGEDSARVIPVAVISLSNECIGVELEAVREFSKIRNFTPIPCCPEHIAGNMNLRGNVLTVIDISGLLNVPAGKIGESTKVIVADSGEFPVGVIVDEILDVIYLKERDIVPVASSIRALNEKFVKGAAFYGSRMMAILDFKEILSWNGLIVNEEV